MNTVLKFIFIKCFLIHRSRIHDLSGDTKHALWKFVRIHIKMPILFLRVKEESPFLADPP